MNQTRRELAVLLPALITAARAQGAPALQSKTYEFASLPVKANSETHNEIRQVFDGATHEGFPIDLHVTVLAAGQMPHAAHQHVWEEVIFIQTGTLEVTINGSATRIGPGSVAYVASNEKHGWKNVGDGPSQYFVLAIGHHA